ncbi:heme-binding beta-barrel domain-containing protein [Halioglobus sp. HI00S01]|uniref:heme-binding beta-barrel domain-containing protein n=1 Tax=Halioglobus sp. HI00S01 TaxID=1822214 RepID=UPI001E43E369|nr:heme-binding beta-barrel domain-containing protein [Halioglobus sp. HI00S01]
MSTIIDGVDYGPLHQLIGTWWGDRGLDVAPEPDGEDKHAYYDQIVFTPAGAAENAEEQNLVCVKYHQVVRKRNKGTIFHDQIGHWMYEPGSGMIMHSLTIPRAVCVLAGGELQQAGEETIFDVTATQGSETFGIVQSPFMLEKAKTTAFKMTMKVSGDELVYEEITSLDIYGRQFEHTDGATLHRIVYD